MAFDASINNKRRVKFREKYASYEYNPDVKDSGLNLQVKFISRKEAHGLDARVILGATVGVMVNRYTHEDQSTSL